MNRWIRCESTKRPGTYFYHNAYTQTSIWHLEDMVHIMPNQSTAIPTFGSSSNLNKPTLFQTPSPQYNSKYKNFTFGKDLGKPRLLNSFRTQNNLHKLSSAGSFDIFDRNSYRDSQKIPSLFSSGKHFRNNNNYSFNSGKRTFENIVEEPKLILQKKRKILYDVDVNEPNYRNPQEKNEEVYIHLDLTNIKKLAPPGSITEKWILIVDDNVLLNSMQFLDQLIQTDPTCLIVIPFVVQRQLEWVAQLQNSEGLAQEIQNYLSKSQQVYEQALSEAKNIESNINSILQCCQDLKNSNYFVVLVSNNLTLNIKATDALIHNFTITEFKKLLEPNWKKISPFPKTEPQPHAEDSYELEEVIELKNKSNLKKCQNRIDEYIVRCTQILENILFSILEKKAPDGPAPWTLYEAVESLKLIYKNKQIQDLSNQLYEGLINITGSSGKITKDLVNMEDFLKVFKLAYNLINILSIIEKDDPDIKLSLQYLKELKNDIENPSFDFDTGIFSRSPLNSTSQMLKNLTLNKENIRRTTQLSNQSNSKNTSNSLRQDLRHKSGKENQVENNELQKKHNMEVLSEKSNSSSSSSSASGTAEEDSGIHSIMSMQIENVIRTLYTEIGEVFMYIHKFICRVVKKFDRINRQGMEVIKNRSTELHSNLINIIGLLHRILAKELTDSDASVYKIIKKYPLMDHLQEDKRFFLYSNMISKLLEQAGILAEGLVELITVLKNSDQKVNLDIIGSKVNYINVFQS